MSSTNGEKKGAVLRERERERERVSDYMYSAPVIDNGCPVRYNLVQSIILKVPCERTQLNAEGYCQELQFIIVNPFSLQPTLILVCYIWQDQMKF